MKKQVLIYCFYLFLLCLFGCVEPQTKSKVEQKKLGMLEKQHPDDSIVVNYRKDGRILSEYILRNGKKNGKAINYYENGKIHSEIMFAEDVKHGKTKWFFENGKIYRISPYFKGKLHGTQEIYRRDGNIFAQIPYRYGQVVVGTKEYSKSGKLINNNLEIKFLSDDKMLFEEAFYLKMNLSNGSKDVEYHHVHFDERIKDTLFLRIPQKKGVGIMKFKVPRNTFIMEKIRIRAVTKTKNKNPIAIEKTYNLAVEN